MSKKFLAGIMAVIMVVTLCPYMLMASAETQPDFWTFDNDNTGEITTYGAADDMHLTVSRINSASGDKVEIAEDPINGGKALKLTKANNSTATNSNQQSSLSAKIEVPERLQKDIVRISFDLRVEKMNTGMVNNLISIYYFDTKNGKITNYDMNSNYTKLVQRRAGSALVMYDLANNNNKYFRSLTTVDFKKGNFSSSNTLLGTNESWNLNDASFVDNRESDKKFVFVKFELSTQNPTCDDAILWIDNVKIETVNNAELNNVTPANGCTKVPLNTKIGLQFSGPVTESFVSDKLSIKSGGDVISATNYTLEPDEDNKINVVFNDYLGAGKTYTVIFDGKEWTSFTTDVEEPYVVYEWDFEEQDAEIKAGEYNGGTDMRLVVGNAQNTGDSVTIEQDEFGSKALKFVKKGAESSTVKKDFATTVSLPDSFKNQKVRISYDVRFENYHSEAPSDIVFPQIRCNSSTQGDKPSAEIYGSDTQKIVIKGGNEQIVLLDPKPTTSQNYYHITVELNFTDDMINVSIYDPVTDTTKNGVLSMNSSYGDYTKLNTLKFILSSGGTNGQGLDKTIWVDNLKIEGGAAKIDADPELVVTSTKCGDDIVETLSAAKGQELTIDAVVENSQNTGYDTFIYVAALYNDKGTMNACNITDGSNSLKLSIPDDIDESYYVKVFVWNNMTELIPIVDAFKVFK